MAKTAPYPRATLRRTIKAHSNLNVSKNVDILAYLNYVLFMQELMKDASIRARTRGEKSVSARDIERATADTLQKFKA